MQELRRKKFKLLFLLGDRKEANRMRESLFFILFVDWCRTYVRIFFYMLLAAKILRWRKRK